MPVVLQPISAIACCPAGCGPNSTQMPTVTVTDVGECVREPLGLVIKHGEEIVVQWIFRDKDGAPVDLTGCGLGVIKVKMQELATRSDAELEVNGEINPLERGAFKFTIVPTATLFPGVYEFQFSLEITENSVAKIRYTNRGYLIIERSMLADNQSNYGPPPVDELLMSVRMGDPAQSYLLKRYEWSIAEIAQCIAKPVQWFNTVPPHVNLFYSTKDFPFEYDWREAIVGHMMEVAAMGYLRDSMTWQGAAPGSTFNDKEKWDPYIKLAQMKIEKAQTNMQTQKMYYNITNCAATLGSPYQYLSASM